MTSNSSSRLLGSLLVIVATLGVHCAKESAAPSPPVETSGTAASAPPPQTTAATPATPATPATSPAAPGTPSRPGQKEGELCGGIAGLQCVEGLTCKMVGKPHPDQAGTCTRP